MVPNESCLPVSIPLCNATLTLLLSKDGVYFPTRWIQAGLAICFGQVNAAEVHSVTSEPKPCSFHFNSQDHHVVKKLSPLKPMEGWETTWKTTSTNCQACEWVHLGPSSLTWAVRWLQPHKQVIKNIFEEIHRFRDEKSSRRILQIANPQNCKQ